MDFDPQINKRSTDELIEIAHSPEVWESAVVDQAKTELVHRGIPKRVQLEAVEKWEKEAQEILAIEMERRAEESFGIFQLTWIVLFWPRELLVDWHLKKDGYIKKWKERLIAIASGVFVWTSIILYSGYGLNHDAIAWQNEVNGQDIYEWERGYYSDEELAEIRLAEINELLDKVRSNASAGVLTLVVLDNDTLDDQRIEQLQNRDPLTIRAITFQQFTGPRRDLILITLVKPGG